MTHPVRTVLAAVLFAGLPTLTRAADDPKAVEFFETKIRPVLVEHCFKCHSEEAEKGNKLRGGLRLDTKAGWQKGGDTGPTIVPGKPADGTLLKSLSYTDTELQMPPKGKLPDTVVKDFEKWIADGAVDPRGDPASGGRKPPVSDTGIDIEKGRQFWSFTAPTEPTVPPLSRDARFPTPIDRFVVAKWAEHGLTPVGTADKRTLLRRAYLDLWGLPPTPEDVAAFEKDDSPDAFAKVVEKLLASPHYGERWARMWLDVARYSEDQAHTFAVKPKTNAWRYRDWVISAFNTDMPFDTFVKLQLAGDLMPAEAFDPFTRLAGLGFLGLGAEYYKGSPTALADELDDKVDTLTRGLMGLTVSCARCHDHKFDPIPTRDYYSLAGVFFGVSLTEAPLAPPEETRKYTEAQNRVKMAEDAVKAGLREVSDRYLAGIADYFVAVRAVKAGGKTADVAKAAGLNPLVLDRWVKFLDNNTAKNLTQLAGWYALKAGATADEVKAAAEACQKALVDAAAAKTAAVVKGVFEANGAPLLFTVADADKLTLTADEKAKLAELKAEVESRKKTSPPAPPMAHVISGSGQGMPVYVRGNPAVKGEAAPKGFLQVVAQPGAKSGPDFTRLDLANAIASPNNPLTARVIVNRVWATHFGRGLVNTPSNFGSLGDRPSHPELLDWLTVNFVKNGWSLKWLHRTILAAGIYQLGSDATADNTKVDAGNTYLWRASRRRLDVEAWRDSLLAVSGNLDAAAGGPTFDLKDPAAKRRTVFAKISRHELDGLLRLFDFPDANVTADKRTVTTVPQQQLFALNSEFMVNQAKAFATRVEKLGDTDAERVVAAYRIAFNRDPSPREVELATRFLALPPTTDDKLTRWQQYAQALLASNELMYVD